MKTIALLLTLVAGTSWAQTRQEAEDMMNEGHLRGAIQAYNAVWIKEDLPADAYHLAKAYALTYQIDSAFKYLEIGTHKDSSLWPLADFNFYALSTDDRWKAVEEAQLMKYQKANPPLEQPEFAKQLLRLIMSDQALDYYIDLAKGYFMKNGTPPHWYFPLGAYRQNITKGNFSQMVQLIERYGWPTYSAVGELAADGPLLVINHHKDHQVRLQFIDQIRKACLEGEGSCMEYAKIQDRILVDENKPQRYGMQFRYNSQNQLEPFPVDDPKHVDNRRAEIGLEPLADYLMRKINYDWSENMNATTNSPNR